MRMGAEDNKRTAQEAYKAFNSGDAEGAVGDTADGRLQAAAHASTPHSAAAQRSE